ncbi:hypothetical protein HYDPIDRAFT_82525 [Hydnomerulius pinastri MD-312]|nr:hypothetical protein HYDPIDRAFT_82525 [Hydnomerulius pinastri MD-312]
MSTRQPPQWPPSVKFISSPRYHSSVLAATRSFITNGAPHASHPPPPKSLDSSRAINPLVRIKHISDPSHPARGQYGLFALKKLPARTHIIDYIGEVHCQERPDSDYDLSLYRSQDGVNVGVDASALGNEARFVNDYRGIQGKPNAAFVEYRTTAGELRMSIWSTGDIIKKGDEILVSYGKSWWRCRNGGHDGPDITDSQQI